jgi:polysaccharide deacetylase family protein (PEP-CTERM system associated)
MKHLLSFDVEEYFHVEAAASSLPREQWETLEKRLPDSVERLLGLLDRHEVRATFFILGWVARQEQGVVRRISDAGHEVASHGMTHAMLQRIGADAFREELIDSRKLLEDISGRQVLGYRAPTFSVTHSTAWALDVLAEAGYRYDSSIFPVRHDRYGVPEAPRFPHIAIGPGGGRILEIPPLTLRAAGTNFPAGGGGYFRLFPMGIFVRALRKAAAAGHPGMIYLHPWEIDPDQPELPLGRLSRWRHRVNLGRTFGRLDRLLGRFRFTAVDSALEVMEGAATQELRYGTS